MNNTAMELWEIFPHPFFYLLFLQKPTIYISSRYWECLDIFCLIFNNISHQCWFKKKLSWIPVFTYILLTKEIIWIQLSAVIISLKSLSVSSRFINSFCHPQKNRINFERCPYCGTWQLNIFFSNSIKGVNIFHWSLKY